MTSASGFFYNRRSRFGRSSDPFSAGSNFGSQPHIGRSNRRHRHRHHNNPGSSSSARRDRINPEVCDSLRRAHHPRQQQTHPHSHPPRECESIQLEDNTHQFYSANVNHSGSHITVNDSLRACANDRLPGAVLLARERLLQRLRGVTHSSTRWSNRNSSSTISDSNSNPIVTNFRLVGTADSETETSREWLSTFSPSADSSGQPNIKQPAGLIQKTLSRLCIEVFSMHEKNSEQNPLMAIWECSICLENFTEGDELARVPCGHRYHFRCLEPWLRTCGNCPYCRRGVDVNLH